MSEPAPEPFTLTNALDVLRSWSWLYDGLKRSDGIGDGDTDRHVAEGSAKGRNRQCSIGWHEECSDRSGINHRGECQCPCHQAEWEKAARFMQWMDQCLTDLTQNSTVIQPAASEEGWASWKTKNSAGSAAQT